MSRPTNKQIRKHILAARDRHGWKNPGHLRYGLCLFACQDVMLQYGAYHVSPDAIAEWRRQHAAGNTHRHPRVGDLVFWAGGRHGHVAIYLGHGKILSTDVFGTGTMRVGDFTAPQRRWNQVYLGAVTMPKLKGPAPHQRKQQQHRRAEQRRG